MYMPEIRVVIKGSALYGGDDRDETASVWAESPSVPLPSAQAAYALTALVV